jgi:hypothetical protein
MRTFQAARQRANRVNRAQRNSAEGQKQELRTVANRKAAFDRVLDIAVKVCTAPALVIQFLTGRGSAILFGLGVSYFSLLSVEGYWQCLNPANLSFVPKFFVGDNANPTNLLPNLPSPNFWVVTIISLTIQAIQAKALRDVEIEKARLKYEALKHHKAAPPDEDAIEIVGVAHQEYQGSGMKALRTRAGLIILTYLIDGGIALWNFPWLGLASFGRFAINFIWSIASVFGTEAMVSMLWDELDPIEDTPKIEVLS